MNLEAIFRKDAAIEDHSLVDHSWLKDGSILNIESMRNPNNIKPQVEVEWGLGGPDIDIDEPAGAVKRNIPEENLGDAGAVILFARDKMNRGLRGSQVVAALRAKYPAALLASASTGLRQMFAMEGIIGRIAIDARGYKNCQAAVKAASNSPYKRFIKYVYGCSCGDHHILPMNDTSIIGSDVASCGNGFDDFLAGDKTTAKTAAYCRTTMLPVMAAGDLDKSLLDSTLIDMGDLTPVPQEVVKKVGAMKASNLRKIQAAFKWLDKKADATESSRYAGKVDASSFQLKKADNEIDFFNGPEAEIEVDGTNPYLMTDIDPRAPFKTNFDGPTSLPGLLDDLEAMTPQGEGEAQIPIELMDERGGATQVQIDQPAQPIKRQVVEQRPCNMDVDFFAPGNMDINLDGEQELPIDEMSKIFEPLDVNPNGGDMDGTALELGAIDVDMADKLPPGFEGTDEISFDEQPVKDGLIDIDLLPRADDTDFDLTAKVEKRVPYHNPSRPSGMQNRRHG